jgi:hypothetical protein
MNPALDHTAPHAATENDLTGALRRVLAESNEPLTLAKIRASLPTSLRQISLEDLAQTLNREVAANVFYQYPKYRSAQERYWDRPMTVHVETLLRSALQEGPMPWSELRRKVPAYAQDQAQPVLDDLLAQKQLHRHPKLPGSRGGELFGLEAADPAAYLRQELPAVFRRLEALGFSQSQLRASALELLHDEEWASTMTAPPAPAKTAPPTGDEDSSEPHAAQQPAAPHAAPESATDM